MFNKVKQMLSTSILGYVWIEVAPGLDDFGTVFIYNLFLYCALWTWTWLWESLHTYQLQVLCDSTGEARHSLIPFYIYTMHNYIHQSKHWFIQRGAYYVPEKKKRFVWKQKKKMKYVTAALRPRNTSRMTKPEKKACTVGTEGACT